MGNASRRAAPTAGAAGGRSTRRPGTRMVTDDPARSPTAIPPCSCGSSQGPSGPRRDRYVKADRGEETPPPDRAEVVQFGRHAQRDRSDVAPEGCRRREAGQCKALPPSSSRTPTVTGVRAGNGGRARHRALPPCNHKSPIALRLELKEPNVWGKGNRRLTASIQPPNLIHPPSRALALRQHSNPDARGQSQCYVPHQIADISTLVKSLVGEKPYQN